MSLYTLYAAHLLADVAGYYERATSATAGRFVPAPSPTRLLDTRTGVGAPAALPGAGAVVDLAVTGVAPVPASRRGCRRAQRDRRRRPRRRVRDRVAVGQPLPLASNLNLAARDVRAEPRGRARRRRRARVAVHAVGPHLLADVTGWFTDALRPPTTSSGLFVPIPPRRMLDTRACCPAARSAPARPWRAASAARGGAAGAGRRRGGQRDDHRTGRARAT